MKKKRERGEIDLLDLIIVALIVIGLIFGIGPCGTCFYDNAKDAPMMRLIDTELKKHEQEEQSNRESQATQREESHESSAEGSLPEVR